MNTRKNNNSVLFLATLGVYLGLVLAGATPQVLAQAAMTRQFNVKDEVEFKDDLDNKPDNEEIEAFLDSPFESALTAFVHDLQKLRQQGKYKVKGSKTGWVTETFYSPCSEEQASAGSSMVIERRDPNEWVIDTLEDLQGKLDRSVGWKLSEIPSFVESTVGTNASDNCKYLAFSTEINKTDLVIQVTLSRRDAPSADLFAERLDQIFRQRASSRPDVLTRQIYEFTKASSEANKVLIVARLPRAGLDSLLATDAK